MKVYSERKVLLSSWAFGKFQKDYGCISYNCLCYGGHHHD